MKTEARSSKTEGRSLKLKKLEDGSTKLEEEDSNLMLLGPEDHNLPAGRQAFVARRFNAGYTYEKELCSI